MSSERQKAANRRNARHSTGPRTPTGKAAVRHNALKHGLLARDVVIASGEGKESQGDFDRLLSDLREDLQPVGVLEEALVERIAQCQWRLRRAARYENAEICRSYGVPGSEDDEEEAAPSSLVDSLLADLSSLPPVSGGVAMVLERTTAGIDQCLELVSDARLEVLAQGHLSRLTMKRLLATFGTKRDSVAVACFMDNYPLLDHDDEDDEDEPQYPHLLQDPPPPEQAKRQLLRALGHEYDRLKERHEEAAEREARQRERWVAQCELDRACLVLPDESVTDRLTRYETAIDRQLYKALDQLERLQRRRGVATVAGDRSQATGTTQRASLSVEASPN